MSNFRLTELAVQDLRLIAQYTEATWGRDQRNKYLTEIDDAFHLLAQQPHRGRSCENIRSGYRKYPVGRHLIFYREDDVDIEIIRILHERMDIEAQLGD